jgi:hypothetical protein
MRFKWLVVAAFAVSGSSYAGPYGDELAKCLVESATKEDRVALVRWMFAAEAANPAVSSIANVFPKGHDRLERVHRRSACATPHRFL